MARIPGFPEIPMKNNAWIDIQVETLKYDVFEKFRGSWHGKNQWRCVARQQNVGQGAVKP